MHKYNLKKQPIRIDPVLQRRNWHSDWGMGNQASMPVKPRHRKYFNISMAAPECKLPHEYNNVGVQPRPSKMSRKPTIVSKRPIQNAFRYAKMVSLGMPRSHGDASSSFGIIL